MQRRNPRWRRRRLPRVVDELGALELQQSQGRGGELDPAEGNPGSQKWRGMAERNECYGSFLPSATGGNILVYRANGGESLMNFARGERSGLCRSQGGGEMGRGGARVVITSSTRSRVSSGRREGGEGLLRSYWLRWAVERGQRGFWSDDLP